MKRVLIIILLVVACALPACETRPTDAPAGAASSDAVQGDTGAAAPGGDAVYHKITAADAKEIMDSGQPYILLDVRTSAEYAESRIDGAMLIPDNEIGEKAESELPDKSALILVYCRSGRRSAAASNELVGMGYVNVYDMGGIVDWPYGTVSGQ